MSRRLRKKNAICCIERAFQSTRLEDGMSLSQSVEMDDYRRVISEPNRYELEVANDWKRLIRSSYIQKFCWIGGLTFLDAKGFRFYLPAYLVANIRGNQLGEISSIIIANLTRPSEERAAGFKLFSDDQKQAVNLALTYLHDFGVETLNELELDGKNKYWGK